MGSLAAAAAFLCWGLFPLYWHQLSEVPAREIVCHRIVWSLGFVAILLAASGAIHKTWKALTTPKTLLIYTGSALLITANWSLYIWGVNSGQVLACSLGYFINPLVNVLLGALVLKESLSRRKIHAVLLAAFGVLIQAWETGGMPWLALLLALTFTFYGLIRKVAPLPAMTALFIETLITTPFALALIIYWERQGAGHFLLAPAMQQTLLILAGFMTAMPLLLFSFGAQRITLGKLGILQFISPSVQFLLAVLVFAEPVSLSKTVSFLFIWTAIALYLLDRGASKGAVEEV